MARRVSKTHDEPSTLASVRRCSTGGAARDHLPPMPGGSITLSPDGRLAAAVDGDNDSVAILAVDAEGAHLERTIAVGRGPVQAAFGSDGRVFVTERRDRRASAYDVHTGARLCSTEAGIDPVGIALAPDQQTLLVTSGLDHRLSAIDTDDFGTRYTVSVPREPRGVSITRDGTRAFIAHLAGEPLSMVDLAPDATKRMVSIPHPPIMGDRGQSDVRPAFLPRGLRPEIDHVAEDEQRDLLLEDERPPHVPIVRPFASQAWSVAIDDANARVLVPFMVSRTGNHHVFDVGVAEGASDDDAYGGGGGEFEREKFSFAFGVFDIRSEEWFSVQFPPTSFEESDVQQRVRVPSAAAIGPDGEVLVASMGTHVLIRLDGIGPLATRSLPTVNSPCGIAVRDDGTVLVYSQFDHAVDVRHFDMRVSDGTNRAPLLAGRDGVVGATPPAIASVARVSIGSDPLDPTIARGRRLFHDATDFRLSVEGLACAGCHPDGRDDGLVWFLTEGPRQTPTLGGRLTRPFNWTGSRATLEANIEQTIHRLGGSEIDPEETAALAAYITTGLPVPDREERPLTEIEAHGRDLFSGAAACDGCHDPERNFTDGARHMFSGARFAESTRQYDTPSLLFVSSTAPYFHDGRFASLRDVLTSRQHHMGHADMLSANDVDALEAYLATL